MNSAAINPVAPLAAANLVELYCVLTILGITIQVIRAAVIGKVFKSIMEFGDPTDKDIGNMDQNLVNWCNQNNRAVCGAIGTKKLKALAYFVRDNQQCNITLLQ